MTMKCDCKQGHTDQIKRFPVGARVRVMNEIRTNGAKPVAVGTLGTVRFHCDDGRASIKFDDSNIGHTFHFPEGYIELWP
jgi:hypothetical protein